VNVRANTTRAMSFAPTNVVLENGVSRRHRRD